MPEAPAVFRVTASPAINLSKAKGDCRLRIGVFDGRLHWVDDGIVSGDGWTSLTANLKPFAGREVLLVLECSTTGNRYYEFAFLDEMTVEAIE